MSGFDCFIEGFRLLRKPDLRRYFLVPAAINTFVLLGLFIVVYMNFGGWVSSIMSWFPNWLSAVYWLVWAMTFVVVLLSVVFFFTFIANIVSSPFNALLSVKVEEQLTGKSPTVDVSIWMVLPRAAGREIRKLLYVLPRLVFLLLVVFIPGVNIVAPFLGILFGAWMMALQYTDYGADNNGISFLNLKERLKQTRLQALLFGLPAYLLLTIPGVNLVLMPIAVAGGTRFWVEYLKHSQVDPSY